VEESRRTLGGLDIVVNVAGHQVATDSIEKISADQFDETSKTNVYAMFWICKAMVPHLKPGATIINTASIQASQPSAGLLDYASTEAAAIVAFTNSLAKQLASKCIRVNAVAAGPVWTPTATRRSKARENPRFRWQSSTRAARSARGSGSDLCPSRNLVMLQAKCMA